MRYQKYGIGPVNFYYIIDDAEHVGSKQSAPESEIDEDMMRRRQLYKEMRAAADCEDYEKAAMLRDQIRELESGERYEI